MPPVANLKVLPFDNAPSQGAYDVSEMWTTLRLTYSPSVVTVSLPKKKILHFVCTWKWDRIMDKQKDRWTIQLLDAPYGLFQV